MPILNWVDTLISVERANELLPKLEDVKVGDSFPQMIALRSLQLTREQAKLSFYGGVSQQKKLTIKLINDYASGMISFARMAEDLDINYFELKEAFDLYANNREDMINANR